MDVLMVGVGPGRVGGMWTVAEQYITDNNYNKNVNLQYVATSTNGSIIARILYMLKGYIQIQWKLLTKHIDIVHIHMAEKGSTFRKGKVAKWSKKKGKKVIIHLHAGPFMAWYKMVSAIQQKKIREIFDCADRVLVLGEYWKRELTEIIPEKKMTVLYNGIECPKNNPYNINARNIVYFGVMRKEKGTYDLINAIRLINDQMPKDIKIVLCGNDLEGDIQKTIDNADLKDRFELPGWVKGTEKEKIYQNAMIDILPSYYEGLSMTVLEAMAKGVPVITTNISTMPEVLGKDGVMIMPGDYKALANSILVLAFEHEKRKAISEYEYSRVRSIFSRDLCIRKTLSIYNSLLKG